MRRPGRYTFTTTIVYEYRGSICLQIVRMVAGDPLGEYVEVVVVVAGDGEVPHPAVVLGGGAPAVGDRDSVVGGLEVLALFQLGRSHLRCSTRRCCLLRRINDPGRYNATKPSKGGAPLLLGRRSKLQPPFSHRPRCFRPARAPPCTLGPPMRPRKQTVCKRPDMFGFVDELHSFLIDALRHEI
jgi:hypothetical protein